MMKGREMRVLVCDDDEASRYLLSSIVTTAGHEATVANNGHEALRLARENPPDVIISDILMPDMDGYALAQQWRADENLAGIPFIFYSANYTEPDDERFAHSLGVDRFLIKPMEPDLLLREIERILNLAERGDLEVHLPDLDESELLREYNARLVHKLENQLNELSEANQSLEETALALRHTEHALSGIIAASPVAILTLDTGGLVTLWNPAAERIFGWTSDEVIGKPCPLVLGGNGQDRLDLLHGDYDHVTGRETVVHARDERAVTVSLSAARLDPGEGDGVLAMLTDITAHEETKHDLARSVHKLEGIMNSTVTAIAKIVEARDPYTSGHQERVGLLAEAIAREMGYEDDVCDGIRMAGLIHDIGKVYVPAEILTKPRRLTDVEFAIVKLHPEVAYDVLSPIEFPWPLADYVIQHHERMDGSGYPKGLTAEDILPGSRILAVADVVEAMSSHRPYKVAMGIDAALEEIALGSGRLYDADVATAVDRLIRTGGFEFEVTSDLLYSK
jgi:PAS domain S-box-containing protein